MIITVWKYRIVVTSIYIGVSYYYHYSVRSVRACSLYFSNALVTSSESLIYYILL